MVKKTKLLQLALILFLYVGVSSCAYFYEELNVADTETDDFAYVYYSYEDFKNDKVTSSKFSENINSEMHDNLEKEFFVDFRTTEGYSTWSQPKFTFTGSSTMTVDELNTAKNKISSSLKGASVFSLAFSSQSSFTDDLDHTHVYTTSIVLNSPPAHLHLCLNSLNERGEGSEKRWGVLSVEDESGNSLEDDPDWTNYTDNIMLFKKAKDFIYTPGDKRSENELKLFGTVVEHPNLFGTYTVTEDESKKVTLTLSFPTFPIEFEVLESSWTTLTLKGEIFGKKGIMKLEVLDNMN